MAKIPILSGKPIYTTEDCIGLGENEKLQGKILVLTTDFFYDEYKQPEYQLVYCEYEYLDKICCRFLIDKEFSVYARTDFIGRLNPADLPEWAQKKLITIINKQISNKNGLAKIKRMLEKRLETADKKKFGGQQV